MADGKDDTPASPANNDVSPPGKTPPSKTSKPVIITHHAVLNDPMVVESKDEPVSPGTEADKPRLAKTVGPVKLQPLSEKSVPETSDTTPEKPTELTKTAELKLEPTKTAPAPVEKPAEPATKPAASEELKDPTKDLPAKPADEKPAEPTDEKILNPENDGDVQAQAGTPTDPAALEEEEAKKAKHEAEIQKLADSKKYYLPINAVEKRRSKRALIALFLVLILAVAWVDLELDAGMIHISGIKPITNFFPNK